MPATDRRYCAAALRWVGRDDLSPLVDRRGRIVLFDTKQMAQDFLPLMGSDRLEFWSADGETLRWSPVVTVGWNEAVILTPYDPYDVPNGWGARGIHSEAEGRDWRWHVIWCDVRDELDAWAQKRNAGAYAAIGADGEGQEGIEDAATVHLRP